MGRINTYPEASSAASDDYLLLDGSTNGTRKIKSGNFIDPIERVRNELLFYEDGEDVTSEFISGRRKSENPNAVIADSTRVTAKKTFNLKAGDIISISGTYSGIKYAIGGKSTPNYDSGWKTSDFVYTVVNAGTYYVQCAKTDGTSPITPEDATFTITVKGGSYFIKKGIQDLEERTDASCIYPEIRNGSIGNVNNADAVAHKYPVAIPDDVARIDVSIVGLENPQNYYYLWNMRSYSRADIPNTYDQTYKVREYDSGDYIYVRTYDPWLTIPKSAFDDTAKAFGVGVFACDKDTGNIHTLRTTDVDTLSVKFIYNLQRIVARFTNDKTEDEWMTVYTRNGSIGSYNNPNNVSFVNSIPINKEAGIIDVKVCIDNAEDYYFTWLFASYSQENIKEVSVRTYMVDDFQSSDFATTQTNHISIPTTLFSDDAVSFAVTVGANRKDDNTAYPLRESNVKDGLKVRYTYLSEMPVPSKNYQYARNIDKDAMLCAAVRNNNRNNNSGGKDFCMLEITDSHSDVIAERNAVQIANGFPYIDALIHCGDHCQENAKQYSAIQIAYLASCKKPFFFVAGNHDVGNTHVISNSITNAEYYTRYVAPLVTAGILSTGEYAIGKGYYYHDFASANIRLIVVYEYDDPNDVDPSDSTKYIILRGNSVISYNQAVWFCDTLKNTPNGYSVIVAMHNPFSNHAECITSAKFNQDAVIADYQSQRSFSTDFWAETIDAFVNRTSDYQMDMVCTDDAEYLNVNGKYFTLAYDFSDAVANFMCFLGGHTHHDLIWQHPTYTYQKQVSPICANSIKYEQQYGNDIPRTVYDSPSKDSLTAIAFDTENSKLRLVKIGQNVTKTMNKRDMECIDLATNYLSS